MTIEANKSIIPSRAFYERPYVPSSDEASQYLSIPLRPVEAHSILVDRVGKKMSVVDKLALQRISELDESDTPVDYKKIRKQVAAELDVDDSWS